MNTSMMRINDKITKQNVITLYNRSTNYNAQFGIEIFNYAYSTQYTTEELVSCQTVSVIRLVSFLYNSKFFLTIVGLSYCIFGSCSLNRLIANPS